jgi:MFS family permease
MILGMMSGGFVMHGIAYLELPVEGDGYIVTFIDGSLPNPRPGTGEEYCANNPSFKKNTIERNVDLDPRNKFNLYNWYTKLGLVCKGTFATSMIAFVAIAGVAISCLFIPRMGDLYGRRYIYITAVCAQVPVYFVAGYFSGLYPVYVAAFFLGPCVIGRMSCGFLLIME